MIKIKCVGCIVQSHSNRIILQKRDSDSPTFPDCIALFGGHIEDNESPITTLIRELKEELGAEVNEEEVVYIGEFIQEISSGNQLLHIFFWHDRHNTITGCYEGKLKYYENIGSIYAEKNLMKDIPWALDQCKKLKIIS